MPALGSSAAACPGVGGLTGIHGTSPEHLQRNNSELPARCTQERDDFLAAFCCAQLPQPGES